MSESTINNFKGNIMGTAISRNVKTIFNSFSSGGGMTINTIGDLILSRDRIKRTVITLEYEDSPSETIVHDGNFFSDNSNNITIGGNHINSITGNNMKITVNCNTCETVKTSNADVDINGDVTGNIQTSNGRITVEGNVDGDATTSNSTINVGGDICGNASTSNGSINGNRARSYKKKKLNK